MATEPNANISEIDGPYFPVHLQWIPRVGELIDLWSSLDAASGYPPFHWYEVVQVVHKIHDVSNKTGGEGAHFVTVVVRPSSSHYFQGLG